jgi:NADH dehydrogenase
MKKLPVCILGGSGFVGQHLIYRLTDAGFPCRLLLPRPERHRGLRLIPDVDIRRVDVFSSTELSRELEGCATLINLIGILNEAGTSTFQRVHVDLVARLVAAARETGITHFLHLSALNADATGGASQYLRSKGAGEDLAHAAGGEGMAVTSFQPSLIFGPGDHLFTHFASLLKLSPGLFPLACPEAQFAPVYVGDVTAALLASLDNPASYGQRYQLCGPRAFTLRELVEYTAATVGRPTRIIALDDKRSRLQAQIFERLPGQLFTLDNYLSLQTPSVCAEDGLAALRISATDIAAVVPGYLG